MNRDIRYTEKPTKLIQKISNAESMQSKADCSSAIKGNERNRNR